MRECNMEVENMDSFYTVEKNVQMLIYLMKQHGIKKVIASPGTTNITFVASIQQDPYFTIYSAADERSAAYIACGMAAESGEPVALSCTGATASRNYVPGLTEAYYRKLPVLAITSTQHTGSIGQLNPQVIDRSIIQKDIAVMSVLIPTTHDADDEWDCNVKLNTALLALKHRGGGPVHINLCTNYNRNFNVKKLPQYRTIRRITDKDKRPVIESPKVAIFVGAHPRWSESLTLFVDEFCETYNGVVLCDHTSNYHGKYRVQYNLVSAQLRHHFQSSDIDLLIDIGEMSGAYMELKPKEVWRINSDGQIRDTWRKLTFLFDMDEESFFKYYSEGRNKVETSYYEICKRDYETVLLNIPEIPFSNAWIAYHSASRIPNGSILHLGILNSLRSWNFFELPDSVICYCNTGGFGIDGIVSTLLGSSLASPDKTHFLVVGDLAFFYDLNAVANRYVGNNIRILLINNGCGTEFKNYSHFAAQFGNDADLFMAAKGHYGQKSPDLVKHYATDLGFEYITASSKEGFLLNVEHFLSTEELERSIIFEVFTTDKDDSDALKLINHIIDDGPTAKDTAKVFMKDILGNKGVGTLKRIIKG